MSITFKTFAIAGAGNIGSCIIEALLEEKATGLPIEIVLLSRSAGDTKLQDFVQKGVQIKSVSYDSKQSLTSALTGVDVVVSSVNIQGDGMVAQESLAVAAKEAGVKLFVPSEYGRPSDSGKNPKGEFQGKLKALDMPYALFYSGTFPDFFFSSRVGIDLKGGVAKIDGDGTIPISFTARSDVARYIAHVLTSLSGENLLWRTFRIEGDRQTINDVFKAYEVKTGEKINVTYNPVSELEEALKANPRDFFTMIRLMFAKGHGTIVGTPDQLANNEFQGWNPKKVVDVLTA